MQGFFNFLTHAIILLALVGEFVLILGAMVSNQASLVEKLLRVTAASVALLILFGARALGVSLTDLLGEALQLSNPITFGLINVVLPGAIGVGVTWYFTAHIGDSDNITIRIMIIIGTFTIFQFAELYARALGERGWTIDRTFTPNIVFTIAVGLYAVLRYDPERPGRIR